MHYGISHSEAIPVFAPYLLLCCPELKTSRTFKTVRKLHLGCGNVKAEILDEAFQAHQGHSLHSSEHQVETMLKVRSS